MTEPPLRLGTRGSLLARWQAEHVASRLAPVLAPRTVELVIIDTHGDQVQHLPLSAMGGFGVFTRAIQQALLDERVDVAVHSLKDLPTIAVPGLILTATPPRAASGDAFLSHRHRRFADVPEGGRIATSSLRRRAQLWNHRPDLQISDMRGNIDTRLRKLRDQDFDGLILAQAGLERLGLGDQIVEVLDPGWMLPAVGQGAIGLESREEDLLTRHLVEAVNDPDTWSAVQAERAMLAALGGGCLVPIGARSIIADGMLTLRGAVLAADGSRRIVDSHRGPCEGALGIGNELAAKLMLAGAGEILDLPDH